MTAMTLPMRMVAFGLSTLVLTLISALGFTFDSPPIILAALLCGVGVGMTFGYLEGTERR